MKRFSNAARLSILFAVVSTVVFGISCLILYQLVDQSMKHERQHAQRAKLQLVLHMIDRARERGSVGTHWPQIAKELADLRRTDISTHFWVFCKETQSALARPTCSPSNEVLRKLSLAKNWQPITHRQAGVQPVSSFSGQSILVLGRHVNGLPPSDEVHVVIGSDDARLHAVMNELAWQLALVVTLGALLTAALGWWLARWGLKPLRNLSFSAALLGPDRLDRRLSLPPRASELFPLVDAFNKALDRLAGAFNQLETFNANVAHELRSPLSTLIGATQVVLARPRSEDELREVLEGNLEDLERLASMVRDMLFLARADHGERYVSGVTISMRSMATEVAEFFEPLIEERSATVTIQGEATFRGDAGLLKRALSNLVANAIQYADLRAPIVIDISTVDAQCKLQVINRGETMDEATLAHMFDRFYRADQARTRSSIHVGLGLAIVRAVAQMHNGTVTAKSEDGVTSVAMLMPIE